jgi:phosphatidylserine synthase
MFVEFYRLTVLAGEMGSFCRMKNKALIPLGLTTLRLALGPLALYCACSTLSRIWFLPIMITALLSDIYDGVLARRFGVATPSLRRYDSLTDIIFYVFILISAGIVASSLLAKNWAWIAMALGAEAACLSFALIKFKKMASAHSCLAKFFGLALFAGLTSILCMGGPTWVLPVLSIICVIVNAEIILMMLLTNQPPVDILSIFHLIQSRRSLRIPMVVKNIF